MCTTNYDVTHTHSILFLFFKEQSCAYLVELLPLMPAAEFCASLTNNSTTFSIFKFGTFHSNQHFHHAWLNLDLSLVLADSWQVCLPT